ncbi:hypothetical protein GCM10027298_06180 [Epidermidibacterium keratini]
MVAAPSGAASTLRARVLIAAALTPATAVQMHRELTKANENPGGGGQFMAKAKVAIKPLEDRVVVQASEAETTTASGLVIPDTAKEKPQEGTVVAVGPGRIDDKGNRVPMDVKEGDVVIYSKYGGTEVKYANEDYLVLSARDLLAIVEK